LQKEKITKDIRNKIKDGIENYRAASDAPAKVDVYDVIEEVFSVLNPNLGDPGKVSVDEARQALTRAPGITVIDDARRNHFPMPIEVAGNDDVAVGRIRDDISCPTGLALFICGDQLLKGAALNAVQLAELL